MSQPRENGRFIKTLPSLSKNALVYAPWDEGPPRFRGRKGIFRGWAGWGGPACKVEFLYDGQIGYFNGHQLEVADHQPLLDSAGGKKEAS